jgi:Sec-independent protein translocase protein TatA
MRAETRTFGWSTWVVVLVVVALILAAGLLYVAE